jgi:hypothetical protein
VKIPALCARYLGVANDPPVAAAWISRYLPRPVVITRIVWAGHDDPEPALITVERRPPGEWWPDPSTGAGCPSYSSAAQVLGGWPANRQITGLVNLALAAGCRPHVMPHRSPHGRRYRVSLWNVNAELLHGVFDVGETNGRWAGAWYSWGRGDERYTAEPGELRAQLTSARDIANPRTRRRRVS